MWAAAHQTKKLCLLCKQPVQRARQAALPLSHAVRAYASRGSEKFADKAPATSSKGPSKAPVRLSDIRTAEKGVTRQQTRKDGASGISKSPVFRERRAPPTQTEESRNEPWQTKLQTARQAGDVLFGEGSNTSRKKAEKAYERAKASAAGSLSLRPHPRKELEEKLTLKNHSPEAINRALDRLAELGMVDDAAYAEIYARSKWRQSKWAPSRIRMELSRKGLSREDVAEGVNRVFGEEATRVWVAQDLGSEADDDSQEGESAARLDQQLLETVRRRAETMTGLPKDSQRRRLIGWLQRRGFPWSTVSAMLRALEL